jgi:hypothetical protein
VVLHAVHRILGSTRDFYGAGGGWPGCRACPNGVRRGRYGAGGRPGCWPQALTGYFTGSAHKNLMALPPSTRCRAGLCCGHARAKLATSGGGQLGLAVSRCPRVVYGTLPGVNLNLYRRCQCGPRAAAPRCSTSTTPWRAKATARCGWARQPRSRIWGPGHRASTHRHGDATPAASGSRRGGQALWPRILDRYVGHVQSF